MSDPGDHGSDMPALRYLDDEAIEAVTLGDDVVPELATLASFAAQVRSLGDEPAPRPSPELRALVAAHAREVARADCARRVAPPVLAVGAFGASGRAAQRRLASVAGRVAGLGIAARVALGVSVATAGVAGAGVAGALPDGADRAVRDAIEAVTPLDLPGRHPGAADDVGVGPTTTVAPATGTPAPGPGAGGGAPGADAAADDGPGDPVERRDHGGSTAGADDGAPEPGDGPGEAPDDRDRGHDSDADGAGSEGPSPGGDGTRFRGERWDDPGGASDEAAPASAPGDTPDAAGDEGTGLWPARDADAATPTG